MKTKKTRQSSTFLRSCKRFDVTAIQETKDNLGGLEKLERKL